MILALLASVLVIVGLAAPPTFAAPSGEGQIIITFDAPEGVPGLVTLTSKSNSLFAMKSADGPTSVTLDSPVGRYDVVAQPVMSGTKRYVGILSQHSVQIGNERTTRLTVRYALSKSVQEVHLTALTSTSIGLTWNAPAGTSVKVRRVEGDLPATSPSQGVAVRVSGSSLTDAGLKPGTRYSYSIWAAPGDASHGANGPVVITVGTDGSADSGTASYVVKPGTLLATAGQISSLATTGDGVRVVLADGVAPPVPGAAVVLPASDVLRGGYVGLVTGVSTDGRTIELVAGGIGDAFDYYHLRIDDLGSLPAQLIGEDDPSAAVSPQSPSAPAGAPSPTASVSASSSEKMPPGQTKQQQQAALRDAGKSAPVTSSAEEVTLSPQSLTAAEAASEVQCGKFSGTGEVVDFDPGFQLAGDFEMTVNKYGFLAKVPVGVSVDTHAAVTVSGALTASVTGNYQCKVNTPSVMIPFPAGPVPMGFYYKPTVRVGVEGAIKVSNLGAAVTLGFAVDGYVGFKGDNHFDTDLISEAHPLTPQVDSVSGGLTAKIGGDVLIGPGAGSTGAGVIVGLGGTFVPLDAHANVVVPTTPGGSPCLTFTYGGQIGVLLSARAWLGVVDFKADFLLPGLSTTFDYPGSPWKWPTACDQLPNPSDDVLGDGVTKVDDGVEGSDVQWGYLEGFAPGTKAWVLSTGNIADAAGSPDQFASTSLGNPGNTTLSSYSGYPTYDAAAYKVKLIPTGSQLHVRYVFASEEYPEYVGSAYNDAMAVFVNGVNCAFVPGTSTPVSINTINDHTNSAYYVDNTTGASGYSTAFDGLTVPLECTVQVTPGVPVDVEVAVADASDGIFDSAIALLDQGIWSD